MIFRSKIFYLLLILLLINSKIYSIQKIYLNKNNENVKKSEKIKTFKRKTYAVTDKKILDKVLDVKPVVIEFGKYKLYVKTLIYHDSKGIVYGKLINFERDEAINSIDVFIKKGSVVPMEFELTEESKKNPPKDPSLLKYTNVLKNSIIVNEIGPNYMHYYSVDDKKFYKKLFYKKKEIKSINKNEISIFSSNVKLTEFLKAYSMNMFDNSIVMANKEKDVKFIGYIDNIVLFNERLLKQFGVNILKIDEKLNILTDQYDKREKINLKNSDLEYDSVSIPIDSNLKCIEYKLNNRIEINKKFNKDVALSIKNYDSKKIIEIISNLDSAIIKSNKIIIKEVKK